MAKSSKIPQDNKTSKQTRLTVADNSKIQIEKLKSRTRDRGRIPRPLSKVGDATQQAPTRTVHMQAVCRHDTNQTTALLGAHNGGKRLGELSAPAARQKGHPERGRAHGSRIETQLMVAPPVGERDRGSTV